MGACYDYFTTNKDDVRRVYEEYCENATHTDGCSYSGRLNMTSGLTISQMKFDSYDEAHDYVSEKAVKWEDAIAVQYKNVKIKPTKKMEKLMDQIRKIEQTEVFELQREIQRKVTARLESQTFVTCKSCKSKVRTSHIHRTSCPVCNESLATATDLKRKQRLKDKLEKLRSQYGAERKKVYDKAAAKTNTYEWFVGGICSS